MRSEAHDEILARAQMEQRTVVTHDTSDALANHLRRGKIGSLRCHCASRRRRQRVQAVAPNPLSIPDDGAWLNPHLTVRVQPFSVIGPRGRQPPVVVQTILTFTMPCLPTAVRSAFTLRCLRFLLFKDCLNRGGQAFLEQKATKETKNSKRLSPSRLFARVAVNREFGHHRVDVRGDVWAWHLWPCSASGGWLHLKRCLLGRRGRIGRGRDSPASRPTVGQTQEAERQLRLGPAGTALQDPLPSLSDDL